MQSDVPGTAVPVCSRVGGARGEQEEWTEAPIQGDARTVCASPTDAADLRMSAGALTPLYSEKHAKRSPSV